MNLQYVSDGTGRHTAVIVPIEEWNSLTSDKQKLKAEDKQHAIGSTKPSDFRGVISLRTANELLHHVEQARTEWESRTLESRIS